VVGEFVEEGDADLFAEAGGGDAAFGGGGGRDDAFAVDGHGVGEARAKRAPCSQKK
jgi:hypothetical protein